MTAASEAHYDWMHERYSGGRRFNARRADDTIDALAAHITNALGNANSEERIYILNHLEDFCSNEAYDLGYRDPAHVVGRITCHNEF